MFGLDWTPDAWVCFTALLLALGWDHLWGEPPARWHPVVAMGRALQAMTPWVAPLWQPNAVAEGAVFQAGPWWRGMVAWCAGGLTTLALALGLQALCIAWLGVWAGLLLGVLLKPLFAWRMLHQEVRAVEQALAQSLDAGRERLTWLCSRPTEGLNAQEVRETAIETLAENLNDSVVAPLFWFVLLGLPGAALYRWANTADAMWGYRGQRQGRDWTWAGHWSAKADDVLSWLPARITGWALRLVSPRPWSWRMWQAQARLTPSPNGGWPMSAMALALNIRLGKPGVYTLNAKATSPDAAALEHAIGLSHRALWLLGVCVCVSAGLLAWVQGVSG